MAIELVTGHAGEGHVSSADAGRFNAGVCGTGKYVLNTGQRFAYSIESANLIRIASGDAVNQGRHIIIPQNTYEDAALLNGTQGKTRIDVITLRYSKVTRQVDSQTVTVEEASVNVIKGTEVAAGSTPEVPAVVSGNIFDGAMADDMPLYHVLITDTSVTSVTPVFDMLPNIIELQGQHVDLQEQIDDNADAITNQGNALSACGTRLTAAEQNMGDMGEDIGDLQTLLSGAVMWKQVFIADNVTIGVNGGLSRSRVGITVSGYKVVALAGTWIEQASSGGTDPSWCTFTRKRVWNEGNTSLLDFYVWNENTAASAKVCIKVYAAFVKNALFRAG